MTVWRELTFGDVATFINGRAFKPTDWGDKGLPIIRIQNLTGSTSVVNRYAGSLEDKYLVRAGDLLISWSASLGVFIWKGEDAALNQHIFKVEVNESLIDKSFFYFFVQTKIEEMKLRTHGSTMTHITKGDFERIRIPLPPLDVQRRIVDILVRAERLREQREKANDKAATLMQNQFIKMFGDPHLNEKGWPIKKWSEVLTIVNGKNQTNVVDENGQYPIYGSGGVMGYAKDFLCPENSVVVGRKGTINKPLHVKTKFWNVDTAFGIVPNKEVLEDRYLYSFCKLFDFERLNTSTTLPSLTKSNLLTIDMPVPPMALQKEFTVFVESYERLKMKQDKATEDIEALFDALLAKAFSGELVS